MVGKPRPKRVRASYVTSKREVVSWVTSELETGYRVEQLFTIHSTTLDYARSLRCDGTDHSAIEHRNPGARTIRDSKGEGDEDMHTHARGDYIFRSVAVRPRERPLLGTNSGG